MSKDRLKRLKALEARRRPPAVVVDPEAVAAALRRVLAELAIVRRGDACLVPRPIDDTPPSPAERAVRRLLEQTHERLAAQERQAAEAKRAAKLERRAKRRAEAAQRVEPPPPATLGLPEKVAQAPAAAPSYYARTATDAG